MKKKNDDFIPGMGFSTGSETRSCSDLVSKTLHPTTPLLRLLGSLLVLICKEQIYSQMERLMLTGKDVQESLETEKTKGND